MNKTVKCIDITTDYRNIKPDLTLGRHYQVLDDYNCFYEIINDHNEPRLYYKLRFEEVKSDEKKPLPNGKHIIYYDDRIEVYFDQELIYSHSRVNEDLFKLLYEALKDKPIDLGPMSYKEVCDLRDALRKYEPGFDIFSIRVYSDGSACILGEEKVLADVDKINDLPCT